MRVLSFNAFAGNEMKMDPFSLMTVSLVDSFMTLLGTRPSQEERRLHRYLLHPIIADFVSEFGTKPSISVYQKAIEYFVAKAPNQYMWILRLLRTQQDGRNLYREMRGKL